MILKIQADLAKSFSLASQQNAYPLVKRILLSVPANAPDDEREEPALSRIRGIRVRLTTEPELLAPEEWQIDQLICGQSTKLQDRPLRPHHEILMGLTEEITVKVTIAVSFVDQEGVSGETFDKHVVNVLPADHWGGEERQPELLAAFVQPNTHTAELLTAKVTQLLRATNQGSRVDGYQSNTRERPYLYGDALWSVMFNERFTYLSPPQGWAREGQRIRSAADVMQYKTAACLDTSVMFASCIENMGLNPVIAMTKDHAFAGFWLIDESFPVLTNDDPIDLRKRVDASDLVMFETTLVTNDSPVTFRQAIEHAKHLLSEELESDFVMLIDIKQARARKIKPLATIEEKHSGGPTGNDLGVQIGLGTVPVLPPVRCEERVIEETPATRVDMWQRKLLDLTKRNPLLNVKSTALKLYCPDLGALEDRLAAGDQFNFMAAEETGLDDNERSSESFLLSTGDNIHREVALEQFGRSRLIVNDAKKRMENKLIELLRKAKNDLEEGGSNTLYLSIGMLRWRETPDSEKSFRAPLILLPVKLDRRSANAPVTMRQLPDEEPLFNLTLIEMLQADYNINLDVLRNDLPADVSGVDVEAIWNIVRDAIRDQKGFIVVEDIVLGSFSFAKYLMWKDLRDRTELLKQSPFVEHLVDRPSEAYQQESSFIQRDEVDQKVSPSEFFAPLNCDSSQAVAVAGSAKAQDFVLEGPPGTGKSETIANIICHNIAIGRKVLFVAEKMAALQVVYRRMEKIGLAHLVLELHSNKANKKSVLDQLGSAWSQRELASQLDWIKRAKDLEEVRYHLNQYVAELHLRHVIGFSPRDAMSRVVRYQYQHPLRLEWSGDLDQAPIKYKSEVDSLLEIAKEMGIAYAEVADLDPNSFASINQAEWSNAWRASAVDLANKISIQAASALNKTKELLSTLGLELDSVSVEKVISLSVLAELCEIVTKSNVDFALTSGGSARVATLHRIASLQAELLDLVSSFGHGLKWSMLKELSWEGWIARRDAATGFFGYFLTHRLRKEMKRNGLDKIDDLSILETAVKARSILDSLTAASQDISGTQVWSGVDTDPASVRQSLSLGERVLALFSQCVGAFPDATVAAPVIRRFLVEGRDFLAGSQLAQRAAAVESAAVDLKSLIDTAESFRIEINKKDALAKVSSDFRVIADSREKLSRWCRWFAMKQQAISLNIAELSNALESRVIQPHECEANMLTALCFWLAPILIDRSVTLRRFAGASHEATIEKFKELDADLAATASEYIAAKAAGNVPDRTGSNTPAEYGVLARELAKKTRHKPVRALVTEMGSSITNLTPCFMMSPLSVAQFLPADFALFDLVVFDEASQITPWDAVGAIARGKNVIVVGDPKQMPPSNNFGRSDEDDSDEGDMESILDQALAARLPHLRLTGHYRSRHETLIAFSNSHYYENALTTFPSAETKQSAVILHRVQGVYAKGRGQTNAIEAQAVVNEVVRRLCGMLEGGPLCSLGIVTINSQQQRIVEDFLDEARRKNFALERFFVATDDYDPVFVKNLESVQGDERDIIVLSLTYGPTEQGGKTMSMNFGPLNKQGGERRLNVAVTRATTEVLVFSSFDSGMIDLTRTQARAVAHLKNYLEFAERGPIALAEYSYANYGVDQFDSDFEHAVALSLREKGWKIQTQVGVSKFRVDMGVVHPDRPGEYLAGIECDGATYHGSPSARDRDRVRQAILENLGWRIIRLWSTDYFQDPEYAMRKMHERLEQILANDRAYPNVSAAEADRPGAEPLVPQENVHKEDLLEKADSSEAHISDEDVESLAEGVLSSLTSYSKDCYFKDDHRINLSQLAKSVLELKNGITLHELTLDVAHLHGLARTSQRQYQYLRSLIENWAGIWEIEGHKATVWLSPNDICEEIAWRGYTAFGIERTWAELCYQEQVGIAKAALAAQPDDPVDWIFKQFQMSRRSPSTIEIFGQWVNRAKALVG